MRISHRFRRNSLLFAAIGTIAATAAAHPFKEPLECERAEDWVRQNHAKLPTTLIEFSQHTVPYRRAIFRAVTNETRVALWREHLQRYSHPAGRLTDEQRALVLGAERSLEMIFASGRSSTSRRELASKIDSAARVSFSDSLRRVDFMQLGGQASQKMRVAHAGMGSSLSQFLWSAAAKVGVAESSALWVCECNVDFGCSSTSCTEGPERCNNTDQGCGPFNAYPCNGMCDQ